MSTTVGLSSITRILAAGAVNVITYGPHLPKCLCCGAVAQWLCLRFLLPPLLVHFTDWSGRRLAPTRGHLEPVSPRFRRLGLRKACQPTRHSALAGIYRCYAKMTAAIPPALSRGEGVVPE